MTLKDQLLDVKDTGLDDLLARLNLRRAPRGASRFALPALALAGAAAAGWLVRRFRARTPERVQSRRSRSRGSAHRSAKAKAVNKTSGKARAVRG
jgi:hypothetical protein